MSDRSELDRLMSGVASAPPVASTTLAIEAPDAAEVVDRARAVLAAVLRRLPARPTLDEWRWTLPSWFVAAHAPEMTSEQAEAVLARYAAASDEEQRASDDAPWQLGAWLYWFESGERPWEWWDVIVDAPDRARVFLHVDGWPSALGAAVWLFRACGAETVSYEEELD